MTWTSASMRIYSFASAPTVNDDANSGYEVGNFWRDTTNNRLHQCKDNTVGAALWERLPAFLQPNFTPVLEFGGGTTGITYSTQTGSLIQIGELIHFSLKIVLTSKGSSTGEATISGLPNTNGSFDHVCRLAAHNCKYTVGYNHFGARMDASDIDITLFEEGDDVPIIPMDDVNFNNDSELRVSGFYFI